MWVIRFFREFNRFENGLNKNVKHETTHFLAHIIMSLYLDLLVPEDKFIFDFLQTNRKSPIPLPAGILLQQTIIQ